MENYGYTSLDAYAEEKESILLFWFEEWQHKQPVVTHEAVRQAIEDSIFGKGHYAQD